MTYTIPRYPAHLIDFVSARGRRVTIRPMLPQDFGLQREFFRSLSAAVRYSRFMAAFNELPDGVAARLDKFDYTSHVALLAEVVEDRSEMMVGEARYVMDEHDPAACEFAIAVADNWQGYGIGRALLAQLEREAAASGIRRMYADTLYDNKAMRGLAVSTGYAVTANAKDARLVRLQKQVSASTASNVKQVAAQIPMRNSLS
jgi:GNAT superfamily N-acetyltransferase